MPNATIPEYKSTTLVQHIADTINKNSEIKYCFILGAGASKSSGISTGYELSKVWFDDIKRLYPDYTDWVTKENIDEQNLAKHYGKIYKKRFEINPVEGYEFLQTEMARSSPSFGYSILAQLLEKQHNVVITTNFDSLVEDALFLYSENKPLVCGHESLSEFVKPTTKRPIIIKVHRDLLLNPKNEEGELLELEKGFADSLDRIFIGYTPIVIGYAGNDLSLMTYLKKCSALKSIFWCKRTGDNLSDEIKELLTNKNGKVFEIAGYDELMFQIFAELFSDSELDKKVKTQAEKRAEDWANKLVELSKGITDNETQASLSKITKNKRFKDWWDVQLAVDAEEDVEKKNKLFIEGLKVFEKSPELNCNYAIFLKDTKKDYENAEKYYLIALGISPNDAQAASNYANFLHTVKNYSKAESYYLKALELDPNDAYTTGNYALFLTGVKKNYGLAEKYYLETLKLNPYDANTTGNYALFLVNIKKEYGLAEKYYIKALKLNPNDANVNSNYAFFLSNIQKNFKLAQKYYLEALKIDPNDTHIICNYASFLSNIQKNFKLAQKYYLEALKIDPNDANTTGNYAQLLIHSNNLSACKRYINQAFILINKEEELPALKAELWLYRFANFYTDYPTAAEELDKLIAQGVKSEGWDFSINIEKAKEANHPEIAKVIAYAETISGLKYS